MKGWGLLWPLAFQLVLVAYLGWMVRKIKQGKQSQDALLDELVPGTGCRWFRVHVSRPEAFSRRLKWLPFEGCGLLLDDGATVRIVSELRDGQRLDQRMPKQGLQIEWAGNSALTVRSHWLHLKGQGGELMVGADVGMNARASRDATADLFRSLLPGRPLPAQAAGDFAIDKNRAAAITTGVLLALLVLAGIDAMANDHELLSETAFAVVPLFGELAILPLLGILLALPVYWVLRRRRVPTAESAGLTFLLAVAVAVASVPVAKRLDQLLAPAAQPVAYRLVGSALLQPVQPGPPELRFPELKRYWAQFERGSEHSFMLVHGPLGLWQLDRAPLHEKTRSFYAGDDKASHQPAAASAAQSVDAGASSGRL